MLRTSLLDTASKMAQNLTFSKAGFRPFVKAIVVPGRTAAKILSRHDRAVDPVPAPPQATVCLLLGGQGIVKKYGLEAVSEKEKLC